MFFGPSGEGETGNGGGEGGGGCSFVGWLSLARMILLGVDCLVCFGSADRRALFSVILHTS